jgi:superfamily II DNA/RNA helicase
VTASATADSEAIPSSNNILITSRSAVPGLDIPNLTRVILINGLDLAGVSPAQRARGGVKRRAAFYQVVSGRMGRLGSVTYNQPGQVVSFVSEGSGEELGLGMCVPPEIRRSGDDANVRL